MAPASVGPSCEEAISVGENGGCPFHCSLFLFEGSETVFQRQSAGRLHGSLVKSIEPDGSSPHGIVFHLPNSASEAWDKPGYA